MAEKQYDPEIDKLIRLLGDHRSNIKSKIEEIEKLGNSVHGLFPDKLDHRSRHLLDERLKTVSTFYSTVLSFSQEFNRSVRDEIEIRRKLSGNDVETDEDIRAIAKEMVKLQYDMKKKEDKEKETENE